MKGKIIDQARKQASKICTTYTEDKFSKYYKHQKLSRIVFGLETLSLIRDTHKKHKLLPVE